MKKPVLRISFVCSMFKYQLSNKMNRTYYYILQTNSTHFDTRIIFQGFLNKHQTSKCKCSTDGLTYFRDSYQQLAEHTY